MYNTCKFLVLQKSRVNLIDKNNTARWEKGVGQRFFCLTEPTFPLPYCNVVAGCQADGLAHLLQYMREYKDESPKQGSKRFNSQVRRNALPIWVHNLSMVDLYQVTEYHTKIVLVWFTRGPLSPGLHHNDNYCCWVIYIGLYIHKPFIIQL